MFVAGPGNALPTTWLHTATRFRVDFEGIFGYWETVTTGHDESYHRLFQVLLPMHDGAVLRSGRHLAETLPRAQHLVFALVFFARPLHAHVFS